MKLIAPLLIVISLSLLACRKNPEDKLPGLKTTVTGQFYDDLNQEGYTNLRIKIGEYKETYGPYGQSNFTLVKYLDSTLTNADGTYTIDFTTTGQGNAYFVEFKDVSKWVSIGDKGGNTASRGYTSKRIENIGAVNNYGFSVFKSYYMQARVIVRNNPHPPVYTGVGSVDMMRALTNNSGTIFKANNDTIITVPIIKSPAGFYLYFSIYDPVTKITYQNPKVLINIPVNKDTIQGGQYVLDPATFK